MGAMILLARSATRVPAVNLLEVFGHSGGVSESVE